jgi:predicted nuclease of predicted toxin-antitoxin system
LKGALTPGSRKAMGTSELRKWTLDCVVIWLVNVSTAELGVLVSAALQTIAAILGRSLDSL